MKALVVLTDGVENQPRTIAEVGPQINDCTCTLLAWGNHKISVYRLYRLSPAIMGGTCWSPGLSKQIIVSCCKSISCKILAGISNAEVVLDPDGQLIPGRIERIPFQLTAGDAGVDVILLTRETRIVDFRLPGTKRDHN